MATLTFQSLDPLRLCFILLKCWNFRFLFLSRYVCFVYLSLILRKINDFEISVIFLISRTAWKKKRKLNLPSRLHIFTENNRRPYLAIWGKMCFHKMWCNKNKSLTTLVKYIYISIGWKRIIRFKYCANIAFV